MTGFALFPSDSDSANSPLSIWHLVDNLDIFELCTNEYGKKTGVTAARLVQFVVLLAPIIYRYHSISFSHVLSILPLPRRL